MPNWHTQLRGDITVTRTRSFEPAII
jgi:hypothetical protein